MCLPIFQSVALGLQLTVIFMVKKCPLQFLKAHGLKFKFLALPNHRSKTQMYLSLITQKNRKTNIQISEAETSESLAFLKKKILN